MKLPIVFARKDGNYYYYDNPDTLANDEVLSIVIGPKNGMVRMSTVAYEILHPIEKEISGAMEVKEDMEYYYPNISFSVYYRTLCFLREVYKEHKSEGSVLLTLDRNHPIEGQEYGIIVPEQEVGPASVDYSDGLKKLDIPDNIYFAGTIHSHPDFKAYQSGIDHKDEIGFDGIHVTLGHIMKDSPEIHERLCISGEFYTPEKLATQITPPTEAIALPVALLRHAKEIEDQLKTLGVSLDLCQTIGKASHVPIPPRFEVPKEWLKNVKKKTYGYVGGYAGGYHSNHVDYYHPRGSVHGVRDYSPTHYSNINNSKRALVHIGEIVDTDSFCDFVRATTSKDKAEKVVKILEKVDKS